MKYETMQVQQNELEVIGGAVELVNLFYAKKLMLEAQMDQYQDLAKQGKLAVIQNEAGEIMASAAYTMIYPGNIWEFGGWAVDEKYQGQGLGLAVMKQLFIQNPYGKTIAFGNDNSGPIFEMLGAVEVPKGIGLPKEVYGPCAGCPAKPDHGCCDKIYHLGPIVAKLIESEGKDPNQIPAMSGWNQMPHQW